MKKESTKFIEQLLPKVDYMNDFMLKMKLFELVRLVKVENRRKK